ncbi:MAG: 2-hydroxyacid dehydrogenase [Treponema sp.]|nr:2-hydroxyacid dehydrogenase [Treponema sp.]
MKLAGIGDLFIPHQYIKAGMCPDGVSVKTLDWETGSFEELQNINLLVEKHGSEAYEVPPYIVEAVKDADILVTQFCPVNEKLIDACPNLKMIGVLRSGLENINISYATEKKIAVLNTPGRNADSVADFTVGALICEARNIARGHHGLKSGVWIRQYPNQGHIPDLSGKTAGIIGFGEIGMKVAKRLSGFDMRILAYDPFRKTVEYGAELVDLKYLMANSDFITLHARLTEENQHIINAEMLALMKPTAYIINTARAGLVDETALYEALKNKKIAGAMLDVFEKEPPGADYPLVTLDNVTLTPHMAGGSNDAFFNSPKKLAAEIEKALKGEMPRSLVNTEIWEERKWS